MRNIYDLRKIKDNDSVASHLNDFDAIWSQLQAQKMTMDDEQKAVFLLCTLLASWDTFFTGVAILHFRIGNFSIITNVELY